MEVDVKSFYKILAPRISALITTVDSDGRVNAAPFSFLMPVSMDPPFLAFACGHGKDTLLNVRETKEFVVNLPPKNILKKLYICNERFPREVNELEKANLTPEKSKEVKPPRIKECFAWLECKLEFEREDGDHVLLVGRVITTEIKDDFLNEDGSMDVAKTKLLLHISGKEFMVAERIVKVRD